MHREKVITFQPVFRIMVSRDYDWYPENLIDPWSDLFTFPLHQYSSVGTMPTVQKVTKAPQTQLPPLWISLWAALSSVIVLWG